MSFQENPHFDKNIKNEEETIGDVDDCLQVNEESKVNMFSQTNVQQWSDKLVKVWKIREINPEIFYFYFVSPGEKMNSGAWSKEEYHLFLVRFFEWTVNGQSFFNSWGNFSKAIPNRNGYQCMLFHLQLVAEKELNYEKTQGFPPTALGDEWETEEVKEMKDNVDRWLEE